MKKIAYNILMNVVNFFQAFPFSFIFHSYNVKLQSLTCKLNFSPPKTLKPSLIVHKTHQKRQKSSSVPIKANITIHQNLTNIPIRITKQYDQYQTNQEHARTNQQEINALANWSILRIKKERFLFLDRILGLKF